jgi:hypothetical protein
LPKAGCFFSSSNSASVNISISINGKSSGTILPSYIPKRPKSVISNNILSHNSYGAGGYFFTQGNNYIGSKIQMK